MTTWPRLRSRTGRLSPRCAGLLVGLLPDAEQGIAYGVPCFKVDGKGIAGFASYAKHCSYFPMSGSITAELASELQGLRDGQGIHPVRRRRAAPG